MTSKRNQFIVGLFVLVGFSIAIITVIWLGVTSYFEKGHYTVAYFDESVQGLDKDSPVKYRGVSIGKVYRISVAPDANLIEVVMKIETNMEHIDEVCAQLKSVGITGIMFIELDRKTPQDVLSAPKLTFEPPYPLVITRPSDIRKFMTAMEDILKQASDLNVARISAQIQAVLTEIEEVLRDADVKGISKGLQTTLDRIEKLIDPKHVDKTLTTIEDAVNRVGTLAETANRAASKIDGLIASQTPAIATAVTNLKEAIVEIRGIAESGNTLVKNTDNRLNTLQRQLTNTLQQLEMTADHLQQLSATLADQPSLLIRGTPPQERELPR
jgi:phospholipid/cholesterol/gamma-HCH transport system substrate-binding protein